MDRKIELISELAKFDVDRTKLRVKNAMQAKKKVEISIVKASVFKTLGANINNDMYNCLSELGSSYGMTIFDIILVLNHDLSLVCVKVIMSELYANNSNGDINSCEYNLSIYKNKFYYKGIDIKSVKAIASAKAMYDAVYVLLHSNDTPTYTQKKLIKRLI